MRGFDREGDGIHPGVCETILEFVLTVSVGVWRGCLYHFLTYRGNNASKGAPGPVKTLHISWRLHCYGELTLDLMPGTRSLQIHNIRGMGENLSHYITFFQYCAIAC